MHFVDALSKLVHTLNPTRHVCMRAKDVQAHLHNDRDIALTSLPTRNCKDCRTRGALNFHFGVSVRPEGPKIGA